LWKSREYLETVSRLSRDYGTVPRDILETFSRLINVSRDYSNSTGKQRVHKEQQEKKKEKESEKKRKAEEKQRKKEADTKRKADEKKQKARESKRMRVHK
jgi:hypothetical protein